MRFQIGSLDCKIESTPFVHAELLAHAYGSGLVDIKPREKFDLVFHIVEEPQRRRFKKDSLVVKKTHDGHSIETDPIICTLRADGDCARASVVVRDQGMNIGQLGFHLWLITNRILILLDSLLLHAAAIELNEKVNLFCGDKGAGKSTISVALGLAGATILTEDHLLLRRRENHFWASGCTSRMRITKKTEDFMLRDQLGCESLIEGDVSKKEIWGEQFFNFMPYVERKPTRLFFNHVGESFSVRKLSTKESLIKLIGRTANMYRFAGKEDYGSFLELLASFVRELELYELVLGPDLNEIHKVETHLQRLDKETVN